MPQSPSPKQSNHTESSANSGTIVFNFEADFIDSLRCIPMQVRYKLDTCGIKLKLQHWHSFSYTDRQQLTQMACESGSEITIYREYLCELVMVATGDRPKELPIDPEPDWLNASRVPEVVIQKAHAVGIGKQSRS
jgi:hypothetical protein